MLIRGMKCSRDQPIGRLLLLAGQFLYCELSCRLSGKFQPHYCLEDVLKAGIHSLIPQESSRFEPGH